MKLNQNPIINEETNIINNLWLKRAIELAHALKQKPSIGIITGEPGTGKTIISMALANQIPDTTRICCSQTMSTAKDMILALATLLGLEPRSVHKKSAEQLFIQLSPKLPRLLILDEANFLRAQQVETLRGWVDEKGISVLFIGTELFLRLLAQDEVYFSQFTGRIGNRFLQISNYQLPKKGERRIVWHQQLTEQIQHYFPEIPKENITDQLIYTWHEKTQGNFRIAKALADLTNKFLQNKGGTLTDSVIAQASLRLGQLSIKASAE